MTAENFPELQKDVRFGDLTKHRRGGEGKGAGEKDKEKKRKRNPCLDIL